MNDVSTAGDRKLKEVQEDDEIQIIEEQESSDQENRIDDEPEVCSLLSSSIWIVAIKIFFQFMKSLIK